MTLLALTLASGPAPAGAAAPKPDDPAAARRAAVALNYCRSAFHRIRENPTEQVLAEEQKQILNNLNLTAIGDEEIVELYTSTLDEISDIQIAAKERTVVKKGYGKSWRSLATLTAFGLLTDVSEFNYASLMRRGASSWWDFRGIQVERDMDLWKVQKERLNTVQAKSADFLEASWKLIRSHRIPDRWIVRNADFDRLQRALQEPDLKTRLRMLDRLAPFMECYPPYWYYVGRTQQQLGEFAEAEKTYLRAAELGDGHFRRDELLAAAMVNVASIREYLGRPGAVEAARTALDYTTDAPNVNLAAAAVLMRGGSLAHAEDAILCNLDSGIETEHSEVALLAVYARGGDSQKLLARLDDAALVNRTPIPILLRCAANLRGATLPEAAAARLHSTLRAYRHGERLVLVADPAWNLDEAEFAVDEAAKTRPKLRRTAGRVTVQFPDSHGSTTDPGTQNETIQLRYRDDYIVTIALAPAPTERRDRAKPSRWRGLLSFVAARKPKAAAAARPSLAIASIETRGALISLNRPSLGGPVQTAPVSAEGSEEDSSLADITPPGESDEPWVMPATYDPRDYPKP